jgi:hypothetical protein
MTSESLEFLNMLFARTQAGSIALTALPVGQGNALTCHVSYPGLFQNDRLLQQALSRLHAINIQGKASAVVGIATRRTGLTRYQRGSKADLVMLPALFADIDQPPAETVTFLTRFNPPPSITVASGFGTHAYWLLAEPTSALDQSDKLLAGLSQALGGDRMTIAQSMRLPGTFNLKPGRGGQPCRLLECHPQRLYAVQDFAMYLPVSRDVRREAHLSCQVDSLYLDELAEVIAEALITDYGGLPKQSGWIASLCPAGHCRDHPGKHFYFHPQLRLGHCFGRHGRMLLKDLKQLVDCTVRHEQVLH